MSDGRDDIAARLVRWFGSNARDLPWRSARDPYRVWVSEVMLQQTRVATVIPYYHRFVQKFPTVVALAEAEVGEVLAHWSGLGYYRRARALHEGARHVARELGGELPRSVDGLLKIPGVGPYTAGAIASLAMGLPAPLVDGNVVRVISRLFCLEGDARAPALQREVWRLAGALLPADTPGAFNEALMELGATVCVPRDPMCLVCPVAAQCLARQRGLEKQLPMLAPKKAPKQVRAAALVARRDGSILLGRRRADALFGGLHEPPTVEIEPDADPLDSATFARRARVVATVKHTLTHRTMLVDVLVGEPAKETSYPDVYDEVAWHEEATLASLGLSTLTRKIIAAAGKLPPQAAGKAARAKRDPAR